MFNYQIRMCFQDVDGEGIVYHSNYLNYAERARTEWLSRLGLQNQEIMELGVAMVIRHIEMDFIRPAKLDDVLDIDVRVTESKNASTIIEQTISVAGETKVTLKLQLVYVDTHTLRPTRIPAILKQKFEENMKGN
ncbi:MAG: YbgC/FadM family acyl-CoA thioesterase [Alphaproteobacteria bacterium]|nr:YbgC/FadM family acyl-CoA thioesterase [Alphaproteobacteria bacterium]